jgi:hypothetical protein
MEEKLYVKERGNMLTSIFRFHRSNYNFKINNISLLPNRLAHNQLQLRVPLHFYTDLKKKMITWSPEAS